MARLPTVDECTYGTRATDDGRFVGYVEQFPNIRTSPHRHRLDALDDVMTKTAAKLARLDDAADDRKAAPRR